MKEPDRKDTQSVVRILIMSCGDGFVPEFIIAQSIDVTKFFELEADHFSASVATLAVAS